MPQLIVNIDNETSVPSLRKAIGMLKGVVSTAVVHAETKAAKRQARQAYVRESLTAAINELDEARRTGREMQTAEEFLAESGQDMSFFDGITGAWDDGLSPEETTRQIRAGRPDGMTRHMETF